MKINKKFLSAIKMTMVKCRNCGKDTYVLKDWQNREPKTDLCFDCWLENGQHF